MTRVMDGTRDELGRLVLGNPREVCRWCGAPAVPTAAGNGRAVWWHLPADCCPARRTAQIHADAKAARDKTETA